MGVGYYFIIPEGRNEGSLFLLHNHTDTISARHIGTGAMSEKNRTKTESETKDEQKRNNISPPFVFLCLLAGILVFGDYSLATFSDILDRWIVALFFLITPLTLVGIACGLPYYRNKDMVVCGLLVNVFLWITSLTAIIADLCYHFR